MASRTVAVGRTVIGARGCSAPTGSSIKLRSTRSWAVGRSSCVKSCWQLLHSSLPGRLSWPQLGQIMMVDPFFRIPRGTLLFHDPGIIAGKQVFQLAAPLGPDH